MAIPKVLIIYHQIKEDLDCQDGIVSAWVAYNAKCLEYQPTSIVVQGRCYDEEFSDDEIYFIKEQGTNEIIIVDFSFHRQILDKLADFAKVTVIDHHETAIEDLKNLSDRIYKKFDLSKSGSVLTWEYYFPDEPIPAFIQYVNNRDLWKFELYESKAINAALFHLRGNLAQFGVAQKRLLFSFFEFISLMNKTQLYNYLYPLGNELLVKKQELVKQIVLRHEFNSFGISESGKDPTVPVVYLAKDGSEDYLRSEICQELYTQFPKALFVACYLESNKTWELRSNPKGNNTDVGEIARKFGGGGHRNASGFKVKNDV